MKNGKPHKPICRAKKKTQVNAARNDTTVWRIRRGANNRLVLIEDRTKETNNKRILGRVRKRGSDRKW